MKTHMRRVNAPRLLLSFLVKTSLALCIALMADSAVGRDACAAGSDLVPTALSAPVSALVEQTISVTWTVQNQGAQPTAGSWFDALYLSPDPSCCLHATFVGEWLQTARLVSGAAYIQTRTATVPDVPPGNYYLMIMTDDMATLPEGNEANNVRAVPITITSRIDLVPTALVAPASASTQQAVTVSWTVQNQGTGAIASQSWDELYFSPNPACCNGATFLLSVGRTGALAAGASYTQRSTTKVPTVPAGSYYLIVLTDTGPATGAVSETNELNNERVVPITITTPDLVPTALIFPTSVAAGQTAAVTWTVKNQGTGPTVVGWIDLVAISPLEGYTAGTEVLGYWNSVPLLAGASYTHAGNITVPKIAAGSYYVFVDASSGFLYEADTSNNLRSRLVTVTTPDLVPTALTGPASASTGQSISVSWTVKNQGTGPTLGSWSDTLHLSPSPTCCVGAVLLGQSTHTALAAGASYTDTRTVTVPSLAAGSYYMIFRADAASALYEANDANNERVIPITVTTPDLMPTALTPPNQVSAGQLISVSWTVKNRGLGATVGTWIDALYVSPSPICCTGATLLAQVSHSALAAGASYTQAKSVSIPNLAPGSYYVILWTDAGGQLYEADNDNNRLAAPITVTGVSAGTLAVTSVNGGSRPTAGTPFPVVIQARNTAGLSYNVTTPTVVALSLKSGGGVLAGTLTGTIPVGASQTTLGGVTYTKAESGVMLTASRAGGDALAPGDGPAFTVGPGAIASYTVGLPSSQSLGVTFAVSVTARDRFANPVTTDSSTSVTLSFTAGRLLFDANADGVFGDATKALTAGVLTMSAKSMAAGSNTIVATDARGKTGSAALTVTAGAPATLVFTMTPGGAGTTAGLVLPGPPTVAVQDGFGNTTGSSSDAITIAIGANPGSATLSGTRTKNAVAGVASFGDLIIDKPAYGYTLVATAPGLTPAATFQFDVLPQIGTISGRVTRAADGQAVAGADIIAIQGPLVRTWAITDAHGNYSLHNLTAGSYRVQASYPGLDTQSQSGISVTNHGITTADFSLPPIPGLSIRITSPLGGEGLSTYSVLVQGEWSAPPGAEVGVSVNGFAAASNQGQFGVLIPVALGSNFITATAVDTAGHTATATVQVYVPNQADDQLRLAATPASGPSPLGVQLSASTLAPSIVRYAIDFEGDGVTDLSSSTFAGSLPHTYNHEGLFFPTLIATDSSGRKFTATTIVNIFTLPDLVGKWNALKDALRRGDIATALQFIATDSRARYEGIFTALGPALAQVDPILTDLQLVAIRRNTAEFSMVRLDGDGVQRSYHVLFIQDNDGLWRLLTF